MSDPADKTQAFQPSIPPPRDEVSTTDSCGCPAGAWHLRSCDLVYWPPDDEEEVDGDG